MEGYQRTDQTLFELLGALGECMQRHPEQRLGQLLININGSRVDMTDLQNQMWQRYDEEWIEKLRSY
jgi:hypothetical protein